MQHTFTVSQNGTEYTLPFTVIKSRRKTMAISIDRDGEIFFRVPLRTSEREIMRMAEEKSHWIITNYLKIRDKKNSRPVSDLSAVQRSALEKRYKDAARGLYSTAGRLLSCHDRGHLRTHYHPRPENEMGKLQQQRNPLFQLAADARAACRIGLCSRT